MRELEKNELMAVDGGLHPVLIGLAIAAGASIINNWDDFKKGFMSAF